jgi:outer membrane protein assembly factor BamB
MADPVIACRSVRVAWAAPLALAGFFATACNDLSPDVGDATPSCLGGGDASTTNSGPYGPPTSVAITGGASNMAQSGVTGDVVISDQFNNRVLVVDRQGSIAWAFGSGSSAPGPKSIVAPNDAEYLVREGGDEVLIAGTGAPSGTEPTCCTNSCLDDRVVIVDVASGKVVWEYGGHGDDTGLGATDNPVTMRFGSGKLNLPTSARLLATPTGDHVLISDSWNHRVIEVDRATGEVVWQYPAGRPPGFTPQSAERLATGTTLIASQGNPAVDAAALVVEVNDAGVPVWQYPSPGSGSLNTPGSACRLASGATLIADSNDMRVLVVMNDGGMAPGWPYYTEGGVPTSAVRLGPENGSDTLITLNSANEIIQINAMKQVVYSHGGGPAGSSGNELNAPYNAKVVGDYTCLTAPTLADAGLTDAGHSDAKVSDAKAQDGAK